MDTNEEMAVKIVRDCLTTARESLPSYVSRLWVREMPELEFHGTMALEHGGADWPNCTTTIICRCLSSSITSLWIGLRRSATY